MRQANYSIKFVVDGEIIEVPSIIESLQFSIDENQYMNVLDNKILVVIPNDYTINVNERFIKMDSAWKIINIDKTKRGLLTLTCERDIFNSNDNIELEIADVDRINIDTYSINITNTVNSLYIGDTLQINTITKKNNEVVSTPVLAFNVSDNTIATIDNAGLVTGTSMGTVDITVEYEGVTDTITLSVGEAVLEDNFAITIEGSDIIKKWSTQIYTAKVINNGLEVSEGVTWEVSNSNVSISSQDESTINLVGETMGTLKLTATLIEDNNIITTRDIEVISAW